MARLSTPSNMQEIPATPASSPTPWAALDKTSNTLEASQLMSKALCKLISNCMGEEAVEANQPALVQWVLLLLCKL